jgi:serine/threonine-protein kinase
VYEVQRTTDRRHLATKVLGGRLSKTAIARFAREAQLLAKLKHPNLISIVDADVTDKHIAYIVMELVRGDNLAALHNKYGDLSFVLPILQQVADALATVHAGGVVHRDLKPADIRSARSDESKLPLVHLGRIEEWY